MGFRRYTYFGRKFQTWKYARGPYADKEIVGFYYDKKTGTRINVTSLPKNRKIQKSGKTKTDPKSDLKRIIDKNRKIQTVQYLGETRLLNPKSPKGKKPNTKPKKYNNEDDNPKKNSYESWTEEIPRKLLTYKEAWQSPYKDFEEIQPARSWSESR